MGNSIRTVDETGLITFDASPRNFQTGQITAGAISAIGSSTEFGIETRNTFTASFLGALSKITSQPISVSLAPGETATFTVVAEDVVSYEWEHNGTIIPDATGPTLEIPNATIDDVGTYQVRLTNAAGLVLSDPVNLKVIIPGDNPLYDGRRFRKIADGETILENGNTPERFSGNGTGPQSSGFFSARAAENEVLVNIVETVNFENLFQIKNPIYKWSRIGLERIADKSTDQAHTVTRLAGGPNAYENGNIVFTQIDSLFNDDTGVSRGNRYEFESLFKPNNGSVSVFGKTIGFNLFSGTSVLENGTILIAGWEVGVTVGSNFVPWHLYYLVHKVDVALEIDEWEIQLALEGGFTPTGSTRSFYPLNFGHFAHGETNKLGLGGPERLLATKVTSDDRIVEGIAIIVNDETPKLVVDTDMTIEGIDLYGFEWIQVFGDWVYFNGFDLTGNGLLGRVNEAGTIEVLAKKGDPVPDRAGRQLGQFLSMTGSISKSTGNFAVSEAGLYFCSELDELPDLNPGGTGVYLKREGQPFETITDDRDVFDGRQPQEFQIWPYAARRADGGRDDLVIQVGFGPYPGGGNGLYTNIIVDLPVVSSVSINATGQVVVVFNSSLGLTHTIESSTNMMDWAVVESGIVGVEGEITWTSTDPFDPDRIFYRVTSI